MASSPQPPPKPGLNSGLRPINAIRLEVVVFSFLRHTFAARVPNDASPQEGPVKLNTINIESGLLGQNWNAAAGGYSQERTTTPQKSGVTENRRQQTRQARPQCQKARQNAASKSSNSNAETKANRNKANPSAQGRQNAKAGLFNNR